MGCPDARENHKMGLGNQILWSGCPADNQDFLLNFQKYFYLCIIYALKQLIYPGLDIHFILNEIFVHLSNFLGNHFLGRATK